MISKKNLNKPRKETLKYCKNKILKGQSMQFKTIEEFSTLPVVEKLTRSIDKICTTKGFKDDSEKPDWSLLPMEQVEAIVEVLDYGVKKYSRNNWQYIINDPINRYFAAAMRHLKEWKEGNVFDKESNLPHLAHAACCLLFLMWFEDHGKEN